MGKLGEQSEVQDHLKGMASHILQEVIRADMSMHAAQMEAWQWFSKHLPKGELINDDLGDGLPRNMYLAMSDLSLSFQVKPEPLRFWKRLMVSTKILFRRGPTFAHYPNTYVMCSPSDPAALKVNIRVSRFKNGAVKVTYGPADEETAALLKTS